MDVLEKANDGKGNRALFSGIAEDSMQQVVLCSDCLAGLDVLLAHASCGADQASFVENLE